MENKSATKRILISLLGFVFVFNLVFYFSAVSVKAIDPEELESLGSAVNAISVPVGAPTIVTEDIPAKKKSISDKITSLITTSLKTIYKNTLKFFVNRLAYDTATRIAEGGKGQSPLFSTKGLGALLKDSAEVGLIKELDRLSKDWLGFGICGGPPQLKWTLHYSLFKTYLGGLEAAECTLSDIAQTWSEWADTVGRTYSREQFLRTLGNAFKAEESDIGMYLTLDSNMQSKLAQELELAKAQEQINQGFKAVTEPISGFIKTPAASVNYLSNSLLDKSLISETTLTGDVIADALSVFTNTLAAKLIKRYLIDGLVEPQRELSKMATFYSRTGGAAYRPEVVDHFAEFAKIDYTESHENVLGFLSQCLDRDNPGPDECVFGSGMASAVEQGYTVKQALKQGLIQGALVVGFDSQGKQPQYDQGLPYRSLLIMRQHRIIPVGWELAALYAKEFGNEVMTLNDLVGCFEDPEHPDSNLYPKNCRRNFIGGEGIDSEQDYNPYYHLVDPNWVLKVPQTYCAKKGAGYKVIDAQSVCSADNVTGTLAPIDDNWWPGEPLEQCDDNQTSGCGTLVLGPACDPDNYYRPDKAVLTVTRDTDYCADWRSCLAEDADGKCLGAYGYCLEEEPVWRFNGDACQDYYNTCETLTRSSDGTRFSYLRNTLESCDQNEGGCKWYSTSQDKVASGTRQILEWSADYNIAANFSDRVYLNNQAEVCSPSDAGCTKTSRLLPGVNEVLNGNFALTEDETAVGWGYYTAGGLSAGQISQRIFNQELEMSVNNFTANGLLAAATKGFIPIDSRYSYNFSYKIKTSSAQVKAKAYLTFYSCQNDTGCVVDSYYPGLETHVAEQWEIVERELAGIGLEGDFQIPEAAKYVKITLYGPKRDDSGGAAGRVWFDEVQLVVSQSPILAHNPDNFSVNTETYYADYNQNEDAAREYIKIAPDYLECQGYNQLLTAYNSAGPCLAAGYFWRTDINHCVASGDDLCAGYATYCQAEDLGCQGYTPLNGDPEIPGRVGPADACPAACVGYDSFLAYPSFFAVQECPLYDNQNSCQSAGCAWSAGSCRAKTEYQDFIPETAQICQASSVGCEQFTNLDEVSQGGEGLEYFSKLRQCISPDSSNIASYFTWEGSDTTGYQLTRWELLKSDLDNRPCTNVQLGSQQCLDSSLGSATCNPDDYAQNDPEKYNCRTFINAAGSEFNILQDRTIIASSECHPYRRTLTGQVYLADPAEGQSCSPAQNGCGEYKGNRGNNVRNVIADNFETGSFGNWQNSPGTGAGLLVSSESIEQGGHSLRIATADDAAAYPLSGQISANKQYLLYVWAKKKRVAGVEKSSGVSLFEQTTGKLSDLLGKKVQAQEDAATLEFSLDNLSANWNFYTLGPVEFSETVPPSVMVKISALNLTDTNEYSEIFFIDNVILKEVISNFYVIADSWQTPNQCDAPYQGAALGCQQYVDRGNQTAFLKSFSVCSSAEAIGCEAFINTQNSSYAQHWQNFNTGVCDITTVGEQQGDSCYIRGEAMCELATGATACNYWVGVTPGDEIAYLINEPEKKCSASAQGCERLGSPSFNRQIEDYNRPDYITGYETVYLVNNPDYYQAGQFNYHQPILCSETGLFCGEFTGGLSGTKTYYDPSLSDEQTSRTCYFNGQKWVKSGTDNTDCYDNNNNDDDEDSKYTDLFLPDVNSLAYDNWVGLCPANQSSCTEYRDPEAPRFKSTAACDAYISPNLSGICTNLTYDGAYCEVEVTASSTINGVPHKVCRRDDETGSFNNVGGCTVDEGGNIHYTAYDWYCRITGNNPARGDTDCCVGPSGSGACSSHQDGAAAVKVCKVRNGQFWCAYDLLCDSYYYLNNSLKTGEACEDGLVDREAGCLMFNNTSNADLNWSAQQTADGKTPTACNPEAAFGAADYCNANTYLSVTKDRQCAEWLQCASAVNLSAAGDKSSGNQYACVDLIRCKKLDPANPTNCLEIVPPSAPSAGGNQGGVQQVSGGELDTGPGAGANQGPARQLSRELTFSANEVDTIRNLSGFSHVGLQWSADRVINGYYSPENMSQLGGKINVYNSGFESFSGDIENPDGDSLTVDGWLASNPSDEGEEVSDDYRTNPAVCGYQLETDNIYAGNYSLKLATIASDADAFCRFSSRSGGENKRFSINSGKSYNLIVYAKSQDGSQQAEMGMSFYDASGNHCGDTGAGCGAPANKARQFLPADNWQKYILTISADEIPAGASFARVYFGALYQGAERHSGAVWFDAAAIEPVLRLNEETLAAKDCRLYPNEDSPACSYSGTVDYQGWNGYCLEPDPYYQQDILNPDNTQKCLQWYPVDALAGDLVTLFGGEAVGYQDKAPLYYCLEDGPNNLRQSYSYQILVSDGQDYRVETVFTITSSVTERIEGNPVSEFSGPHFSYNSEGDASYFIYVDNNFVTATTSTGGSPIWDRISLSDDLNIHKSEIERIEFVETNRSDDEYYEVDSIIYTQENLNSDSCQTYEYGAGSCSHIVNTWDNDNNTSCDNEDCDDSQYCWATCWTEGLPTGEDGDYNRVIIAANFNSQGYIDGLHLGVRDGLGSGGIAGVFRIVIKPYCSLIAKAVTEEGDNKAWLSRFETGWRITEPQASKNSLGLAKNSAFSPYGSITGIRNDDELTNVSSPVLVGHGANSYLNIDFTGIPWSTSDTLNSHDKAYCFYDAQYTGVACNSDDDCGGGVCLGVGKFCYKGDFMTGKACVSNADCGEGEDCQGISGYPVIGRQYAITRLQRLFAKVYGVWQWDSQSNYYVSCGEGDNCSLGDISLDISGASGQNPRIDYIEAVNTQLAAPGGLVTLKFSSDVNPDQLPIKEININWNDGSDVLTINDELNHRPSETNPHNFYHIYTCTTNTEGNRCVACSDGDRLDEDVCVYSAPEVTITDNWGKTTSAGANGSIRISPRY